MLDTHRELQRSPAAWIRKGLEERVPPPSPLARTQVKMAVWPGHQGSVVTFLGLQLTDRPRRVSLPSQHWSDANGVLMLGTQGERQTRVGGQGRSGSALSPNSVPHHWANLAGPLGHLSTPQSA